MRYLFYLLLLTNLAVGGWLYWQQTVMSQGAAIAPVIEQEGKPLQLLSELDPSSLKPVATTNPAAEQNTVNATLPLVEPPPTTDSGETQQNSGHSQTENKPETDIHACVHLTDIGSKAAGEALIKKISGLNAAVFDKGEAFEERQAYWVLIPPLHSKSAARDVMATLAKKRVKDYLLVGSGEFENAISLGLFSQRDRADKRLHEMKSMHLKTPTPRIQTKITTVRTYWLKVMSHSQDEHESLQRLLENEGVTINSIQCPL